MPDNLKSVLTELEAIEARLSKLKAKIVAMIEPKKPIPYEAPTSTRRAFKASKYGLPKELDR